jgi:hypothetical protein
LLLAVFATLILRRKKDTSILSAEQRPRRTDQMPT